MTRFKDYAQDLVRASDLRPSTARTYESALRVHIYPFFGDQDVEDVTPTVVRALIAHQLNDGIGSGAMNLCYRLLSKIMHAALADELIQRNPLNAVKPPRYRRKLDDPPTSDEVRTIALCIAPHYRTLLLILAWTGLWIGEAGGLEVGDWDAQHRRLRLRRQIGRAGPSDLKTAAARRSVPLPRWLADDFQRHLVAYPPRNGRVFSTRKGGPVNADTFYPAFRRACITAGVRSFHPHDLRHHAVSAMLARGISPKTVQAIVGHESAKLTLEVYGHVTQDDLDAAADLMEGGAA